MSTVETMNMPSGVGGLRYNEFQRSRSAVDLYGPDYDDSLHMAAVSGQSNVGFKDDDYIRNARNQMEQQKRSSSMSSVSRRKSKSKDNPFSSSKGTKKRVKKSSSSIGSSSSSSNSHSERADRSRPTTIMETRSGSREQQDHEAQLLLQEKERRRQRKRERKEQERLMLEQRQREYEERLTDEHVQEQQRMRMESIQQLEQLIREQQQKQLEEQQEQESMREKERQQQNAKNKRRVRFYEDTEGNVARTIHWFLNENCPDMWWTENELIHTLKACMRTVTQLRGVQGKDYVKALTRLYHSYKATVTEAQTSQSLQLVARLPDARGLELHVAVKLRAVTVKQRQQVLEIQERLRSPHLGGPSVYDDQIPLVIRKEAMKHSRPCRQFAFMIAQYDTHEALRASLSSWSEPDDEY